MAAQALCKSSRAASCSWSTRWASIICHLGIVAAWQCTNLLGLPTPVHISAQMQPLLKVLIFIFTCISLTVMRQSRYKRNGLFAQVVQECNGYRMSPLPQFCLGLYWVLLRVLGRVCAEAATHLLTGCPLQQAQYVLVKVLTWQNYLVCITDTLSTADTLQYTATIHLSYGVASHLLRPSWTVHFNLYNDTHVSTC